MKVELTEAQAVACLSALGAYLSAGSYDECLTVFGSAQGIKAAERAFEKLRPVAYRRRHPRPTTYVLPA